MFNILIELNYVQYSGGKNLTTCSSAVSAMLFVKFFSTRERFITAAEGGQCHLLCTFEHEFKRIFAWAGSSGADSSALLTR
ncbi:MAG: hypothetical protein DMG65_22945 [Candidatus Angelobacter sp. Gp1-AA117]|nr:MAG: hypothetical protein DMG65_22945 [Candidatus Angelobacter sp. Gp1-AA117]